MNEIVQKWLNKRIRNDRVNSRSKYSVLTFDEINNSSERNLTA